MILNLLFITIICCYIIDISGVVDSIKSLIAKILSSKYKVHIDSSAISLKPIDCSLCTSFWCCLIYLIFTNHFTIPYILIASICSFLSKNITGFLNLISEFLVYLENKLYKILQN